MNKYKNLMSALPAGGAVSFCPLAAHHGSVTAYAMSMRTWILGVLVSLLGVTHLAAGMAHGAADPVGSIVICRGHAAVTIHIDADGNEVEGWTLCPEMLGTLLAAVATGQAMTATQQSVSTHLSLSRADAQVTGRYSILERTRGPPADV